MNKNHEGYSDPTASRAIKRMCKELHKKQNEEKKTVKKDFLTYRLDEVSKVFNALKEK